MTMRCYRNGKNGREKTGGPETRKSITNGAEIPWKSWKLNLLIQPNPFLAKSSLIEWAKSIVACKKTELVVTTAAAAAKCFFFGIQRQPLMVKQFQFPVKNLYKKNILLLSKNRSGQLSSSGQPTTASNNDYPTSMANAKRNVKWEGAETVAGAGHEPESEPRTVKSVTTSAGHNLLAKRVEKPKHKPRFQSQTRRQRRQWVSSL